MLILTDLIDFSIAGPLSNYFSGFKAQLKKENNFNEVLSDTLG